MFVFYTLDEISFVHGFTSIIIPLKFYTSMDVNEKYTIAFEVCIYFYIYLHLPNDYQKHTHNIG